MQRLPFMEVRFLGTDVSYRRGMEHMHHALEQTREALREGNDRCARLLLLEHRPVVTVTHGGGGHHVHLHARTLERLGVELVRTDRGGDVTYHGPGQLVGYPIVPLPRGANFIGVGRYLRRLEQALLDACSELGVSRCTLLPGKTGVWRDCGPLLSNPPTDPNILRREGRSPLRPYSKLVAIGIGVSKDGITRHGFAMNVCADLALMQRCIVPCGLTGMGVANLDDVLRQRGVAAPSVPRLCRVIAKHVAASLGMHTHIEQPFRPRLSPRSN